MGLLGDDFALLALLGEGGFGSALTADDEEVAMLAKESCLLPAFDGDDLLGGPSESEGIELIVSSRSVFSNASKPPSFGPGPLTPLGGFPGGGGGGGAACDGDEGVEGGAAVTIRASAEASISLGLSLPASERASAPPLVLAFLSSAQSFNEPCIFKRWMPEGLSNAGPGALLD